MAGVPAVRDARNAARHFLLLIDIRELEHRQCASEGLGGGRAGSGMSGALGSCRLQEGGRLPDPACSPGAVNPDITPDPALLGRTICKWGWTASVRPKD